MIEAIDELTTTPATEHFQQTETSANNAATARDAVVLSETAQVTLLNQEGLSITQIADELGVTLNVVLQDLGIANTSIPAAPSPGPDATLAA
jgi:DNA-binding NarL/FixJ family response regulator